MRIQGTVQIVLLLAVVALHPMTVSGQAADSTVVCAPATAEAYLDVGNVRAKILNNGGLFWNGGRNVYEVPKGDGVDAIFAASLWIGGMSNGELRVAASTYGPWEFWPGPATEGGPSPEVCADHDRIWPLSVDDIRRGGPQSEAIAANWPVNAGAPFVDVDNDGVYAPEKETAPNCWAINSSGG